MFVANSDRLLETAAGNTRASTLRQRIREWLKFSAWCFAVKGVYYDPNPGVLVDYLEELYLQPCARTKLKAVLSAVSLVEKAGAVPSENRLSLSRSVLVTVDTRTAELEQGAPETRRAAPLPLIMVASLELAVMDSSLPRYWRAFAWVRLFKVWTSSRTDDLLGVLPSSMHLGSRGLKGSSIVPRRRGPDDGYDGSRSSFLGVPGSWSRNGWRPALQSGPQMGFPLRGITWCPGPRRTSILAGPSWPPIRTRPPCRSVCA